jgi:hypothetical protein
MSKQLSVSPQPSSTASSCASSSWLQQPLRPRNTNQVQQNYAYSYVNHVTAEDAQQAPDVVFGMFLENTNSAIVLFDSGVIWTSTPTHNQISDPITRAHAHQLNN